MSPGDFTVPKMLFINACIGNEAQREPRIRRRSIVMKNLRVRFAAIFAVALIALGIGTSQAIAQSSAQGSFTLPFEVRWNNIALPAGDYTFDMKSTAINSPMVLDGPNGRIFIRGMVVEDERSGQGSTLRVDRIGGEHFVKDLYLAPSGKRISYWEPKLPKAELLAKGAASTDVIHVSIGH